MTAGTATFTSGPSTFDIDVPPPAGTGQATFYSGVAGFTISGSPIPSGGFTVIPDRPTLVLCGTDGQTKVGNLNCSGLKWQHQISAPGNISFRMRTDDPMTSEITAKRIVKVYWRGCAPMGARIDSSSTDLVPDVLGHRWRSWSTIPGILGMANDGIVYPEFGLRPTSGTTRIFGYPSRLDNWYVRSGFVPPQALKMSDDTGYRKGFPVGLKVLDPSWISLSGAYTAQSSNERHYFHRRIRTFSTFDWQADFAADHRFDLFINGEQVAAKEDAQGQGYRYLATIRGTWEPGDQVIAAGVQANGPNAAHQHIALIGALRLLDANGDPVKGPAFIVTEPNRWRVTDSLSGHHRAETILKCWEEVNERLVLRARSGAFLVLHPGWTDQLSSTGEPWGDFGEPTADIGQSVLELLLQLAEGHIDVDVAVGTMRVLMFKRLGQDRSATVVLKLGGAPGASLRADTVDRVEAGGNSALMQLANGDWVLREDEDSIDEYGQAEVGLSVGSTASESTADDTADLQFNETAWPTRTFSNVEISTLAGPQPYRDFFLGDTVSLPTEDADGTVKARLMAITVDASGDVVRQYGDFVEDRT